MTAETVQPAPAVLREDHGRVRLLTLNRPERRNSLDLPDRRALLQELRDAEADEECRAVVLNGAGKVFSAGGDIRSMSQDPVAARERLDVVNEIARVLVAGSTPVVAAVEGGAFGLGLSLACASDVVVAGETARFVASFAKIGLIGDTGIFYTLPQRVGTARARHLLLTARTVSADEARSIGLVDELVPDGTVLDRAFAVAEELAEGSPSATAGVKQILAGADQSLDGLLEAEAEVQVRLLGGRDFAEGRSAFLERRAAEFPGG